MGSSGAGYGGGTGIRAVPGWRGAGFRPCRMVALCLLGLLSAPAIPLSAQMPASSRLSPLATRAELEARRAELTAEGAHSGINELTELELRLREGDFQVGDRIVVHVADDSALSDTFPVREGRSLELPNLPALSLAGVLRSEVQDHVRTHVARFVRSPTVRATPLVRIAVLGAVAKPGFYPLPADYLVSDAIMLAGGPADGADISRARVRRGGEDLLSRDQLRTAIGRGATIDALGIRAGDEILVPPKRDWLDVVRTTGYVLGAALSILYIVTQSRDN